MAVVNKHHAWKVTEPDVWLYGEDIYGVHSIEYAPVPEQATFHAFALRDGDGAFAAFAEVEEYAKQRDIPVVPVLFRGHFQSVAEISAFMTQAHNEPSALGGERERVVMRLARGFPAAEFQIRYARASALDMCRLMSTGRGNGSLASLWTIAVLRCCAT